MKEMKYKDERIEEVLMEGTYEGFKFFIISCGRFPCCYVAIPPTHKYYKENYDELDVICHGDLFFGGELKGVWCIGWDYAHYGDYYAGGTSSGKKWTTEELFDEVKEVIKQLI